MSTEHSFRCHGGDGRRRGLSQSTETSRISVVRDVADRFGGWQQLTNYQDPENKSGALGGDILKKQTFVENYANL